MLDTRRRHLSVLAVVGFALASSGCEKTDENPGISRNDPRDTRAPVVESDAVIPETTLTPDTPEIDPMTHESTVTQSGSFQVPNVHQFTMTRLDGTEESLSQYNGKVLLVVNTASACGLTPQYEGLQHLYEQHRARGFEILGFPANNFGGQEPGTDEQIAAFCDANYSVTFPMFSKIEVVGEHQHPLYAELSRIEGGEPTWNFTKYLIGRDGGVVARFDPRTTPADETLVSMILTYVEK